MAWSVAFIVQVQKQTRVMTKKSLVIYALDEA
jgi:hypothetical protein